MSHILDKKTPPRKTRAGKDLRSPDDIEQIVVLERLHLYNHGRPCGAAALRRHLREHGSVQPLPSVRQIGQVLTRYGLTYGRTGWYEGEELDWLPASVRIPIAERR
jgi:hypothetical protein